MVRISTIFIAICMVIISASCGLVLYLTMGIGGVESALVAIGVLSGLAVFNAASTRLRDRSDVSGKIADLSRGTSDLARQLAEFGRRLAMVEAEVNKVVHGAQTASPPLAEIGELGALVRELAVTVAAHDGQLGDLALAKPPASTLAALPAAELATEAMGDVAAVIDDVPVAPAAVGAGGPFKGMRRDAVVALLQKAVEANRIELHLQPVVSLPQRKVRFYEALGRLRGESGDLLLAADFLPFAEAAGLMPRIDNIMLFRCVQVVRRLLSKNRDVSLFCNISGSTLTDSQLFSQFADFMAANRALAPSLVLEFTQATYRALQPVESERLAGLAAQGFRFSMDHVVDLRLDPREFADRGFRFIKVPADLLLGNAMSSNIHPADLSGLLGRSGIELIVERIESETAVVDLLDYDVRFGQGFLFSPPRPVRPEAVPARPDRVENAAAPATMAPASRDVTATAADSRSSGGARMLARARLTRGSAASG
ncbi:MAG: EAL domain-containing protein [Proteobacteria bacterium]|nr:EAL domain-containing protein [Pseudomonadota bacterium]